MNIAYNAGDGDVVEVQRRVVESSVKWDQDENTLPVNTPANQKTGPVPYAIAAAKVPFKSTVEFVLVDSKGSKSAPQRVSFEVLPVCQTCGKVASIHVVTQESKQNSVFGAIAGGLAGAVLGHQVGHGRGKDAATAAGAAGGAYAGYEVGKHVGGNKAYEIGVRLDNGKTQFYRQAGAPRLWRGRQVVISNGVVRADAGP